MSRDEQQKAFTRLLEIMERLRKECPWDKKQTFDSLRCNTTEECYELTDAIQRHDMQGIKEELGDVLLHIVFYSLMAQEQNEFDISDVCNGISDKLIYRHPHIYGDVHAGTPEDVKQNWEKLKLKEKGGKKRVLSGVPSALPALIKAQRIQEKAHSVGFDWANKEDVWDKVKEEMNEFIAEIEHNDQDGIEAELGDLIFSLVNLARHYNVNPENALERSNKKFISRFNYVEEQTLQKGKNLKDISLDEMDDLWNEAKQNEKRINQQ
ncbi:MAG: nucleoside triphosphate pyrophosphohydrolase [Candidatus Aphodosoma sp.]